MRDHATGIEEVVVGEIAPGAATARHWRVSVRLRGYRDIRRHDQANRAAPIHFACFTSVTP
jgi:hypothetical protein